MTCIPIYNSETKHVMQKSKKNSMKAVTHYKVVANSNSCALVEVSPETGTCSLLWSQHRNFISEKTD